MPPLKNSRRERFAQAVVRGLNDCQAYKAAGYKGKPARLAYIVANAKDVQARIAELNERASRKAVMTKQEALESLTRVARASQEFFVRFGRVSPRGITIDAADLDRNPEMKAAVREFVINEHDGRVTVKLHAFDEMIAKLAKLEGWEAPQKVDVMRSLDEMSDDQLILLLSRLERPSA